MRALLPVIGSLTALSCLLILSQFAAAEGSPHMKCIIIVSGSGGYPLHELDKASSFRENILSECLFDDIIYLTDPSDPDSDGPANMSNIESAFDWLRINCDPETDVVIYIFDHAQSVFNDIYFVFDDGNISTTQIDSWLDLIECSSMTVILNGERSGLAGPDLTGPSRDIICSMGSTQTFEPDNFSIARSLEDPTADTNNDGKVSFVEAYWKEVENLSGTGQDPVLFQGQ